MRRARAERIVAAGLVIVHHIHIEAVRALLGAQVVYGIRANHRHGRARHIDAAILIAAGLAVTRHFHVKAGQALLGGQVVGGGRDHRRRRRARRIEPALQAALQRLQALPAAIAAQGSAACIDAVQACPDAQQRGR